MQLEQHDPRYPLPDPEYFKVHCRIGQILCVSGIGLEIDQELGKFAEAPRNLDPSGSTDVGLLLSQRMLIDVGKRISKAYGLSERKEECECVRTRDKT